MKNLSMAGATIALIAASGWVGQATGQDRLADPRDRAEAAASAAGHGAAMIRGTLAVAAASRWYDRQRAETGGMVRDAGFPQDTADGLYRAARRELNRNNFREAVELFRGLRERHPQSDYVPQAMYYEAFALNRIGGEQNLRRALELLAEQAERYPDASRESATLRVQIQGALARRGDEAAAAEIARRAAELSQMQAAAAARQAEVARGAAEAQAAVLAGMHDAQGDEDDVRMQALNALLHMDAELAMPILQGVLENRDPETARLRRRAVLLVAQMDAEGSEEILLEIARNDPDLEVREHAVFHLSRVRTDDAVQALDSILRSSREPSLQERAIFALSQHRSERAGEILRRYVRRRDAPRDLRAHAIVWLGRGGDHAAFLRELYGELDDAELRQRVLMGLAQHPSGDHSAFFLEVALNDQEPVDVRKQALFWLGQSRGEVTPAFYGLYAEASDRELKEQLIMVYAQRPADSLAVETLIEIVRTEEDAELQGRAIFWLGRTGDPRAAEVLREIINRRP